MFKLHINKLVKILILLVLNYSLFAQRGKDGNVTVINTRIVNEYTTLTADAASGTNVITVANGTLNQNNRFPGPLAAGDLIYIIQMQGATPASYMGNNPFIGMPNDSSWGAIASYNNCGNNELVEVCSVNGNTITTVCPLKNNYSASGKTQVIRVPRYNTLTINNGGKITCDPWNGSVGGVIALEILGVTTINNGGSIDASEKGFRGGSTHDSSNWGLYFFATSNPADGAKKGEGIIYFPTDTSYGGIYMRGAAANGGGGGNCNNAGGGGGANAGNPALWTGKGVPDNSNTTWTQAWNLEYPGFATHSSSGGGRGGYSSSKNDLNALTTGPDLSSWGGDYRRNTGGLGGRPLDYSTGRLFMGGGGGAGDGNNGFAGAGGNGGGIIYIKSYDNITGFGQIISNGQNGYDAVGPTPGVNSVTGIDAAGGGGAGGTVYIHSTGTISNITILASGGRGGNQVIKKGVFASDDQAEGPGGGGGGGYIATTPTLSVTKQVFGGVNGTTNSSGLTEFIHNGATKGAGGIANTSLTAFSFTASNDTICTPGNAELCASLFPSQPGTGIYWYNSLSSCTPINPVSSECLTTPVINQTTTYWVGTCPGSYRIPVQVVLAPLQVNAGNDTTICPGQNLQLHVIPNNALNYVWSPAVNPPNSANPIVSPSVSTTYSVTVTASGNCVGSDEIKVTVANLQVYASNDTTICKGDTINIWATGGVNYLWSESGTANTIGSKNTAITPVFPQQTTTYTVVVSTADGSCSASESVTVNVSSVTAIVANPYIRLCPKESVQLNACGSTGATNYVWSPITYLNQFNICNPVATLGNIPVTFTVTASNDLGCKSTEKVIVFVYPDTLMQVTDDSVETCSGVPVQLGAQGGNTYQWSAGATPNDSPTPTVTPTTSSYYTVTITSINNCVKTDRVYVSVGNIVANAGPDVSICQGQSAQLQASGGIYYNWTANPTLSSTSIPNPVATPTQTTTYYVVVSSGIGCSATDSVTVFVVVPTAHAFPDLDTAICIGGRATLYAYGNTPTGLNYEWAPAASLNTNTAQLVYATPNQTTTYTVTVYLNQNCFAKDSVTVFVDTEHVQAIAQLSDTAGCEPLRVQFYSTNPNITAWYWNFGGLGSSISQNPVFTFQNDGIYYYYHTVQSQMRVCSDTVIGKITVYPKPEPNFTYTPDEPLMSQDVQFNDITQGSIFQRHWVFEDNFDVFNIPNPVYQFLHYGKKKVKLIIVNSFGCIDSIEKEINVIKNVKLVIPNVITPDGNGINDKFIIEGLEFAEDNVLTVYNRWGRIVYQKKNYQNDWDGKGLAEGTYYIVFRYLKDLVYTGTLEIILDD